ncbi:MAG: hypothetical protein HOP12_14500 [Candidatus Eisenbacteria bacterium]|uniref:Tetratricopeptide repeat protein n=1 Tax=Eiseniibacteriota bacterium TaxID=2212470 RepID=A0A849SLP1_UNCEI|nr:hypothetical protein [Candidatus Eisenbacteria bacterium]
MASWTSGQWARGVALIAMGLSLGSAVHVQRLALSDAPTEVIAAGRALAADAARGASVMSRKGHIGFYSGLPVVEFPRVEDLAALGSFARGNGADYLYFSWYETQLRPEFAYLLDTTSRVPGLRAIHVSPTKPAVLYRIEPGFGRAPAWWNDEFERSVHAARAMVWVSGDRAATAHHVVMGVDALRRGAWSEALHHAGLVTQREPRDTVAWVVAGEAARGLGRALEARAAYDRALALDSSETIALMGLGRLEAQALRGDRARALWQRAAAGTDDPAMREEIRHLLANAVP